MSFQVQFSSVSISTSTTPAGAAGGCEPTGGRGHHQLTGKALDAAADKLGMSSDDLQQALQSGQKLGDLARAKGVSMDDLRQAIRTARHAEAQAAGGANAPGGPPPGGPGGVHGHHHHRRDGDGDGDDVDSKVMSVIADKLGESADDLKTQLGSGQKLGDLLQAKGVTSDDLRSAIEQAFSSWKQYGAAGSSQSATPAAPPAVDVAA